MSIVEELAAFLLEQDVVADKLEAFVVQHCVSFDVPETWSSDSITENKLEWTQIHQQFSTLLESEIGGFLSSKGVTPEQFVDACKAEQAKGDSGNILYEWIIALSDYSMFVQMMVDKRKSMK
eukprot:PhF_6_TR9911/c0_g1_i1/m.15102